MARPLRIEYPGAVYHITSRGNAKEDIFRSDVDRKHFLHILSSVISDFHLDCFSYCLMDNHYHLLIQTQEANLSKSLRQLNGVYTQRFNKIHKRVGHVFQGRFKAILVQKESYFLELCRYIVLNPVRAGLCAHPREWLWSSYLATAGSIPAPKFLSANYVLSQFAKTRPVAQARYRKFVTAGIDKESPWVTMKHATILGDEDFIDETTTYFDQMELSKEFPKEDRLSLRPSLKEIFARQTHANGERNARIIKAFRIYAYSQSEIAQYLKMHYSSVSRIIKDQKPK